MTKRFEGKVVIVAGAGSTEAPGWGNGRATALAFAREGAQVIAVDRHEARAEQTREMIEAEGGLCLAIGANVAKPEAVEAMVEQVLAAHGRIDVLHHNVGYGGNGDIVTTSPEDYDRIMSGNSRSVFLCMRAVLPTLINQGAGVITTTSSTLATRFIETPSFTYTVAKAAVEAMTRSVAVSHGPMGIRANCIRIGFMDTPINYSGWRPQFDRQEDYDAIIAESAKAVPLRRMGSGWDTAKAAVFLASDDAAYLNGVILPVDGGVDVAPVYIPGLPMRR
jgi:NAD(P)-dependent dehydrogenase (short-subunit alcohol dehydrogenase family)